MGGSRRQRTCHAQASDASIGDATPLVIAVVPNIPLLCDCARSGLEPPACLTV
jgi:hypothetical protein